MIMETETSSVEIPVGKVSLKGILRFGRKQQGMIIFSHGSGSSRLSSRNNYIAEYLKDQGFSSLLFDLLTEKEDQVYENRFDIELLANRLIRVTQWLIQDEDIPDVPIGYFGASTGAASALIAGANMGNEISAIVSRGGRPDLAMPILDKVIVPTLLIVGGDDIPVIELNKKAYDSLAGIKKIEIVEGATHLFSEPGKLDEVAVLSMNWFQTYLK